jgi:hypothetical protein
MIAASEEFYRAASEFSDGVIELSEREIFKALYFALLGHGCDDFLARYGRQADEGPEMQAVRDRAIYRAADTLGYLIDVEENGFSDPDPLFDLPTEGRAH